MPQSQHKEYPILTCYNCGMGGNHMGCSSDGICRCECPYNEQAELAKLKLQIAKEAAKH